MKLSKERLALIAGMIGCLLYVIGDFLFAAIGKNQSAESIGLMVKVAYLDMATCRMVASIICGVVGTALYYVGFHQILFVQNGKVVEQGTHNELMACNGRYKDFQDVYCKANQWRLA